MKLNRMMVLKKIFSMPFSSFREVLVLLVHVVKIQILIRVVPLRYYYRAYFSDTTIYIPDWQLFHKHLSLYRKAFRVLPFRLTCLAESMVIYRMLKRHGILNPIRIGVRIDDTLKAHAWNAHKKVTEYNIIY